MYKIIFIWIVTFFFIGCGTTNIEAEKPIISVSNLSLEPINDNAVKVGAKVHTAFDIESNTNILCDVLYILEDIRDENLTYSIEGSDINIVNGVNTYDMNITLPIDVVPSDSYRLTLYLDYFNELSIDNTKSIKSIVLDQNLSIIANDGVPLTEISSVILNEEEIITDPQEILQSFGGSIIEEDTLPTSNVVTTKSVSFRDVNTDDAIDYDTPDDDSDVIDVYIASSDLLTFDVGYDGDNVIVNQDSIKFSSAITVSTFFAEDNDSILNACLNIGDSCEPVSFYDIDENNNTIEKNQYKLENLIPSESAEIALNLLINKEVLKKIAIYTYTEQSDRLETTFKVYFNSGISMEIPISFEPIELSELEVDNTYDAVGDGNESVGLVFKDLNTSNNAQNYLENIDQLVQDATEYDWHKTVNSRYYVPYYKPGVYIPGYINIPDKGDKKAYNAYNKSLFKKYISNTTFSKNSKYFGMSTQFNSALQIHNDVAIHYGVGTKTKVKLLGKWIEIVELAVDLERENFWSNNPYVFRNGSGITFELLNVNLYKEIKKGDVSIRKEIAHGKSKSKTKNVKLGPVKIKVEGKVEAQAGVFIELGLNAEQIELSYGPFAEVVAEVSASVGGKIASGGISGELSFLSYELPIAMGVSFPHKDSGDIVTYNIEVYNKITSEFSLPKGSIKLYAKAGFIKYNKKLASFKTKTSKKTLYNKKLSKKTLRVYK